MGGIVYWPIKQLSRVVRLNYIEQNIADFYRAAIQFMFGSTCKCGSLELEFRETVVTGEVNL